MEHTAILLVLSTLVVQVFRVFPLTQSSLNETQSLITLVHTKVSQERSKKQNAALREKDVCRSYIGLKWTLKSVIIHCPLKINLRFSSDIGYVLSRVS